MDASPVLRFQSQPFPGYVSSGKVVYGAEDRHPERIFSTFVAMFIEEGILYFTEGGHAYTLTPGQWFIQTPGIRHYGHRAGGVRTIFRFVHFLPQGEWHIHSAGKDQAPLPVKQLDSGEGVRLPQYEIELPMRGRFPQSDWKETLDRLLEEHEPGRGAIAKQARFLELLERMVWLDAAGEAATDPMGQVVSHIRQHFAEPLTVAELARLFHFSPDYLTRRIRRTTGLTPSALIARYRIDRARHLLVHTGLSVQQISREAGYPDLAVFSRTFKKHVGQSPMQYRQEQWGRPK